MKNSTKIILWLIFFFPYGLYLLIRQLLFKVQQQFDAQKKKEKKRKNGKKRKARKKREEETKASSRTKKEKGREYKMEEKYVRK